MKGTLTPETHPLSATQLISQQLDYRKFHISAATKDLGLTKTKAYRNVCSIYINTIHLATSFWPQHLRQFFVALAVFAERTELGGIFSVHLDCEKDNNNKRQRDKNTTLQGKQSYIIL